jgi:hypothetical protein
LAALALLVGLGATAVDGGVAHAAASSARCNPWDPSGQERWLPLPEPQATLVSVGQLDRGRCDLIGAQPDGTVVRSSDAGQSWNVVSKAPALRRIATEALQLLPGRFDAKGPVLASDADSPVPRVWYSSDDGHSFAQAWLAVGESSDSGAGGPTPLRGDVLAATAVAERSPFAAITGKPYFHTVYAIVRLARAAADVGSVPGPGVPSPVSSHTVLVRSINSGNSFAAMQGAAAFAPTVVAVNPSDAGEVWLNDQRAGMGGGVRVSHDGAQTFGAPLFPDHTVRDISVAVLPNGALQVVLATDKGLKYSVDDGATWATFSAGSGITGVRAFPDDPTKLLVQTDKRSMLITESSVRELPGLPAGCSTSGLRRTATIPPTFLMECGDTTYRYSLQRPLSEDGKPIDGSDWSRDAHVDVPTAPGVGVPLTELVTYTLPGAWSKSGALAFDGLRLYYDLGAGNGQNGVGVVDAGTGTPLGQFRPKAPFFSMVYDPRRARLLLVNNSPSVVYAYDMKTGAEKTLGPSPYGIPSYDARIDRFSFIRHIGRDLETWPLPDQPGFPRKVCTQAVPENPFPYYQSTVSNSVSTFVATGDGGGYVQYEDDRTMVRLDRHCKMVGPQYMHRQYAEALVENDTMVCDTQTFFPAAAIWIRDSGPGTVTAYRVPFAYCPMPSRVQLTAPSTLQQGQSGPLCTRLVNTTTGLPAADKIVTLAVDGLVVGGGATDDRGELCAPYTAPFGGPGRRAALVTASFKGDAALFPATAAGVIAIFRTVAVPPAPPQPPGLALQPPVPPVPPPAAPNPGPGPAAAPAPAPAPASAAQAQPVAQSQTMGQPVAVQQRQEQPQLVFARASQRLAQASGDNAMSRVRSPGSRTPTGPPAAVLAISLALTLGGGRAALARCRGSGTAR